MFCIVPGSWGAPEAGVWPHCWLVVPWICALWDALRTGEWSVIPVTFLFVVATFDNAMTYVFIWIVEYKLNFVLALSSPKAPLLQSQYSWDVPQHPAQVSCAEAQCVQRRQGNVGGSSSEGPHQEAGVERWFCKHTLIDPFITPKRYIIIIMHRKAITLISSVYWSSLLIFLQLELKCHSFFSPINWDDLMARKISPPFVPSVVRSHIGIMCYMSTDRCMNGVFVFRYRFVFTYLLTLDSGWIHRPAPQTCDTSIPSSPTSRWPHPCAIRTPWLWPAASRRQPELSRDSHMGLPLATPSCERLQLCPPHIQRTHKEQQQLWSRRNTAQVC